jgi:hypothetical protein
MRQQRWTPFQTPESGQLSRGSKAAARHRRASKPSGPAARAGLGLGACGAEVEEGEGVLGRGRLKDVLGAARDGVVLGAAAALAGRVYGQRPRLAVPEEVANDGNLRREGGGGG